MGFGSRVVEMIQDPSIQVIPMLGPKVCKCYLHWVFLDP